jgi:hypothetical protein
MQHCVAIHVIARRVEVNEKAKERACQKQRTQCPKYLL